MGYKKKNNSLITNDIFFILDSIEKHGYEARVVGGAVRNFLLGANISDIDIATTAAPSIIIDIFQKQNISVLVTSIRYGTIIIVYNGKPYEITSLREDIKTFGRKAEVSFTESFEIDSQRRDFTINAIYMDKEENIFDYHNGISDIINNNIKFIGNPKARIEEDYLRILRYFRFVAYYGNFKYNGDYISLMNSLVKNISILSSERILSELLKIFELQDSYKIIPSMRFVLDELFNLQCDPLEICHRLDINDMFSLERLSMLLKFSKIPARSLINKYNFPRNIKQLLLLENVDIAGIKKKLKTLKKDERFFYVKYVLVNMFFHSKRISELEIIKAELNEFCNSEYVDFNFKAKYLSEYNLSKKDLKNIMMATKKFWFESNQDISVLDCLKFAKTIMEKL
jgi:tRNA nucleotidyltransferase/poly(A) polymerase